MSFIPYGRQSISAEDIDGVVDVLKSDFLTQGPVVPLFEASVASLVGASEAIALNSATSALHVACLSLGLDKGDILWTSPISFVASSNCGLYCGSQVDFVDINIDNGLISVEALEVKLLHARKNKCLPKVLVVVHLAGTPCDMIPIRNLSLEYGFYVIEDASHAIGAKYLSQHVGSCKYSDITIFSFHPVKIITTGEGGMAVTTNPELAERMRLFRSHGITKDVTKFSGKNRGIWYYEQQLLGFNYRLSDLHAALGISQLKKLSFFIQKRTKIFQNYIHLINEFGLRARFLSVSEDTCSSYHLAILLLEPAVSHFRDRIMVKLELEGIGTQLHYYPIHLQPYYRDNGFTDGDFPNSELYAQRAISLPIFPDLTLAQQKFIISKLSFVIQSFL